MVDTLSGQIGLRVQLLVVQEVDSACVSAQIQLLATAEARVSENRSWVKFAGPLIVQVITLRLWR